MAMNNWGGVTEHMRVKRRGFLSSRKTPRKINTDFEEGDKQKFREIEKAKNRKLLLATLLWGIGCTLVTFGVLLFFLNS